MRRALVLAGVLLLVPALATASVHDEPAVFRVLSPVTFSGQHVSGVIEARALTGGALEIGSLQVDRGSVRRTVRPPHRQVATDSTLQIPFEADVDDSAAVFELDYVFGGEPHGWLFDLHSLDAAGERTPSPGRQLSVGASAAPTPSTRTARIMTVQTAPAPPARLAPDALLSGRDITVHGRVVCQRPTINGPDSVTYAATTFGVEGITVSIYHDDGLVSWYQTKTETNADGTFSQTFHWTPLNPFTPNPNIVLHMDYSNDHFSIRNPIGLQTYAFHTGTWNNLGGDLDAGTWTDQEGQQSELDLLNNLMKGRGWYSSHEGYTMPYVTVFYPEPAITRNIGGSGSWYNGLENAIHLSADRAWDAPTCLHEYGHFFMHNYANALAPDYCNGYCDGSAPYPTPWLCGHCQWCPETNHDAWNEGWPDWIAEVQTNDLNLAVRYDYQSEDTRFLCAQDHSWPDPLRTEALLQGLLRDVWDPVRTDDPGRGPSTFGDVMALGTHPIFQVTTQDRPVTPQGFIDAFNARFPQYQADFYSVQRHNGFPQLDNTPPTGTATFTSPSHTPGVQSPSHLVQLSWSPSTDSQSGMAYYLVGIDMAGQNFTGIEHMRYFRTVPVESTTTAIFVPESGNFVADVVAVDRDLNRTGDKWLSSLMISYPTDVDLQAYRPPGWADSTVARGAADATDTSVPLPTAQLAGNAASTYWNTSVLNAGPAWTPNNTDITTGLYVDGHLSGTWHMGQLSSSHYFNGKNMGPVTVTGGRHAFVSVIDDGGGASETNESNNANGRQWVWSPYSMPANTLGLFAAPGKAGALDGVSGNFWFNSTGLRMTPPGTSWWNLMWIASNSTTDYDCRLHWASSSPDTGFGANVGWSGRPAGYLDAVLVNRNTMPQASWDVSVINPAGIATGFFAKQVTAVGFNYGDSINVTFPANEFAIVRELYVSPANVGPLSIVLRESPKHQKLHVAFYGRTFTTGALLDADAVANADTSTGITSLDVTASVAGFYGVVIWTDPIDNPTTPTFSLQMGRTKPDIKPALFWGWHSPFVPRPRFDGIPASVPLPDTLYGDSTGTWLNLAYVNNSPGSAGAFSNEFDLDGVTKWYLPVGALAGWAQSLVNDDSPFAIPAGRHTLTARYDTPDQVIESNENNNTYGEQYVWGPKPVTMETLFGRNAPPDRTGGWTTVNDSLRYFNCDGWRTPVFAPSGSDGYWGAAVTLPLGDVDLRLHELARGTKNSFGASLGVSAWGPWLTDFAIVNFNATAFRAFDVGVLSGSGSTTYYYGSVVKSRYLATYPNGTYGPYTFDGSSLLKLHEVFLTAGPYVVELMSDAGTIDWGLSVYGPSSAFYMKSDALAAAWAQPGGVHEEVGFTAPATGYYCVAAWRSDISGSSTGTYRLGIHPGTLDAPAATTPTSTLLASPRPNPFSGATHISFVLAHEGHATVGVYDVHGARLRTLLAGTRPAGAYDVSWDGEDDRGHAVPAGIYFVRLDAGGASSTRKLVRME